jgi:DNA polymerase III epsilon subunit-like protein
MTVHKICVELGSIRHESVGEGSERALVITYDPNIPAKVKKVVDSVYKKRDIKATFKEDYRMVVVDTETTGFSKEADRICEFGCIELINGQPSGREY